MKTTCNNYLDDFNISPENITIKRIKGLEIQYFSCPSCGAKYVIYAADAEMERLTMRRNAYQTRIRNAIANRFREKMIRALENDLAEVKAQQKALGLKLKKRAEELLKEENDG